MTPAIVENRVLTADEARGLQDLLLLLFLAPQVSKRVDDDAEDQVEDDDDDDEVEEQVVDDPGGEQRLLHTGSVSPTEIFTHKNSNGARRLFLTFLEGFRRTSPTPPPFLSPWFMTVTMHMSRVSHARSALTSSGINTTLQHLERSRLHPEVIT